MKLMDIASAIATVSDDLQNLEISDEQAVAALSSLTVKFEDKAVGALRLTDQLSALANAARDAEKRIAQRRKAIEARVKAIELYVKESMQRAGRTEISSPDIRALIVHTKDRVVIDSKAMLPPEYMRWPAPPEPEPDLTTLWTDLKAGKEIPGAHLEENCYLKVS